MNDGQWHHAIVEADRRARTLTVYVDGKKDGSAGAWTLPSRSPTKATFTWAARRRDGTWTGHWISCASRRGRSSDADTTIEELYAWEFDGPQIARLHGSQASRRPERRRP